MPHYGQVLEDPDYYDEDDEVLDDFEDDVNFIAEIESFDPFETVNS